VILQPWFRRPIVAKTGRSLADSRASVVSGEGSSKPAAAVAVEVCRNRRRVVAGEFGMGQKSFESIYRQA
jgi:hypothetical protein